jgi:hypothetical protein
MRKQASHLLSKIDIGQNEIHSTFGKRDYTGKIKDYHRSVGSPVGGCMTLLLLLFITSVLGATVRHMSEGLLDSHSNLLLMLKDLPTDEEEDLRRVFKNVPLFFVINHNGKLFQDLNITDENGKVNDEELKTYFDV